MKPQGIRDELGVCTDALGGRMDGACGSCQDALHMVSLREGTIGCGGRGRHDNVGSDSIAPKVCWDLDSCLCCFCAGTPQVHSIAETPLQALAQVVSFCSLPASFMPANLAFQCNAETFLQLQAASICSQATCKADL